jgi:hypothetical protein
MTTRRDNKLYLHLRLYPGESFSIANLHDYRLLSAEELDTGRKLKITHEPTRDIISGLPRRPSDPIAPVVRISIRPRTVGQTSRRASIGVADPNA